MRATAKRHLGEHRPPAFGRRQDDLLAVETRLKDKTPVAVLGELRLDARTRPDIELRLAKRLAEIQPDGRDRAYVDSFRAVDAAAMEVETARVLSVQTSIDDVLRMGRDLLEMGRYPWAREVFYEATQLSPNRSAGFSGLAAAREAIGEAEHRAGKRPSEDPRLALVNLVRARDLEPADNGLKAELALRTEEGGAAHDEASGQGKAEVAADMRWLIQPSVFLAAAKRVPAKKGEQVDRQLHWQRIVTYHDDKRVSQLMHYSREIVLEPRTDQDMYEANLPTEGDENEIVIARLYRKDGTVKTSAPETPGRRAKAVHPLAGAQDRRHRRDRRARVDERARRPPRRRAVLFHRLRRLHGHAPDPLQRGDRRLPGELAARDRRAQRQARAARRRVVERAQRAARYIWDAPPNLPDEPLAPKMTEVLPVVVGSTFKSWGDFREWYRAAVAGFTEPDDQVRRLAAELTKGKSSQDEKLAAIFNFVADDIRYVNYISGEWWLPNRPQELLARRQGDCDDKAMLLITLLKSIGINATEVLVQTRYTGEPNLLRSTKAAIPVFDHGIAYLPGKGGAAGMWLDATSPESRLGPVPSMDARTVALFVDEGPAKVVDTPSSSPDEHGIDAEWTIKLAPTGAGDILGVEHHTGDSAFELRMNLKQADARTQWVENYLANGWFPTVQVKGDIDFKSDLPKGAAVLKFEAHSDGLARREGEELAVPLGEATTLTSQLAPAS